MTCSGFSFSTWPVIDVLIDEKNPDFVELCSDAACIQLDCRMHEFDNFEYARRRCNTSLESCFFTWSWAPVTMKDVSCDGLNHFRSGFTGAVQMWENFFHWIGSKYRWLSRISSDPRHVMAPLILFWKWTGGVVKCWRCTPSLKSHVYMHGVIGFCSFISI